MQSFSTFTLASKNTSFPPAAASQMLQPLLYSPIYTPQFLLQFPHMLMLTQRGFADGVPPFLSRVHQPQIKDSAST